MQLLFIFYTTEIIYAIIININRYIFKSLFHILYIDKLSNVPQALYILIYLNNSGCNALVTKSSPSTILGPGLKTRLSSIEISLPFFIASVSL